MFKQFIKKTIKKETKQEVKKPVKKTTKKTVKASPKRLTSNKEGFINGLDKLCKKELDIDHTDTVLFLAHAGTREVCIGAGDKSHLCCMLGVMLSKLPLVEQRTILTFVLSAMSPKDLEVTMKNLDSVVKVVSPQLRKAIKKVAACKCKGKCK